MAPTKHRRDYGIYGSGNNFLSRHTSSRPSGSMPVRGALLDKDQITSFVRAAQQGDERAFTVLVRAMQNIAVAYATSILRDYHCAEDAAQEAFVEAYRELPNLRKPAAFNAWFRTILFKHCDRLTRRKRHPVVELDAAIDIAASSPTPETNLLLREIHASIWQAIAMYVRNRAASHAALLLGRAFDCINCRVFEYHGECHEDAALCRTQTLEETNAPD